MTKLIEVLLLVLKALQAISDKLSLLKRQKSRDELEADPASWYDGHFSGMRDTNPSSYNTNITGNPNERRRDMPKP